jgi:hypothetical protein
MPKVRKRTWALLAALVAGAALWRVGLPRPVAGPASQALAQRMTAGAPDPYAGNWETDWEAQDRALGPRMESERKAYDASLDGFGGCVYAAGGCARVEALKRAYDDDLLRMSKGTVLEWWLLKYPPIPGARPAHIPVPPPGQVGVTWVDSAAPRR